MQYQRQSRAGRLAHSIREAWSDINYAQRRLIELNAAPRRRAR